MKRTDCFSRELGIAMTGNRALTFAGHKRKRHNGRIEKVVRGFIAVSDGMGRMD